VSAGGVTASEAIAACNVAAPQSARRPPALDFAVGDQRISY